MVRLTTAVLDTVVDDILGVIVARAGLLSAVADAVAEVGVAAVAVGITRTTSKVALGDAKHVVDACSLARSVLAAVRVRPWREKNKNLHRTGAGR